MVYGIRLRGAGRPSAVVYWGGITARTAWRKEADVVKVIEAPYTQGARESEKVLAVPAGVAKAPGIAMQGRRIRSLVFSTDLAVICHCNADAVACNGR